jgi:hypothetical protein
VPKQVAALALFVLAAPGCRRKPDLAHLPPVAVVQDFEGDPAVRRWPRDGPGQAAVSVEWAADGRRSLKLDAGMMGSFKDLALSDWSAYGALRFTVHNPGPVTLALGLEIQDDHDAFDDRHQHSFGALPGDHVVELDLTGGLWRGEENRPYRGRAKTPLDLARVTRLAFVNRGAAPLYVDRLELVKVPPIATPGGFAFDFGHTGKPVMPQTTGVFETTRYDPAKGFGLLGPVVSLPRSMSYPTPLLGDGLALGDGAFRVDLPGGPYQGWIAFERGGFWEGEQCGYDRAEVRVNGAPAAAHDFSRSAPHFLFEDLEIGDLSRIEEHLVSPAHAATRFHFQARPGENLFTVAVTGSGPNPLRVAGLLLAPDTPEGTAFLDAHEARQRAAIAACYPPEDRGRRVAGRAPPERDLVAEPIPTGAPIYPHDFPEHATGSPPGEVIAVAGHPAVLQLALYARRPLPIHAEVRPLAGPGGAPLPSPTVLHGRYLPTRPLGNGPVWLTVNHFRPDPDFPVGPDLARAVVLEWRIPRDAAPGVYTGTALFTSGSECLEVPLRARVYAADLPPIPVPVCLLMNALPFGPEILGEARWWSLQEALLDEQARAGLTCVTGGPGLDLDVAQKDGAIAISGDRALRYLTLARARGLDRAVVPYGGFVQLRGTDLDARAFAAAFLPFAEAHALPPFFFPLYDEPGTSDELAAATASVRRFTDAGLTTLGFATRRRPDAPFTALLDATTSPAIGEHDAGDLAELKRRGRHPWVYNNGLDRRSMGIHLWRDLRAGAEGRLEWIGAITQGFAFDDLDGREPSNGAFLIHDRLGVLPTPRWLTAREGLLDLRVRLALEKAAPAGDAALGIWEAGGDGPSLWTDEALDGARRAMLERMAAR